MYHIIKTKWMVVNGVGVWVREDCTSRSVSTASTLDDGALICDGLNKACDPNVAYHLELKY